MNTIQTLRCSSLPLAFACPASLRGEGVAIDPVNPEAALGSAAHEAMRQIVQGGLDEPPPITPIAQRFGVDPDELMDLVWSGVRMVRQLRAKRWIPESAACELSLTDVVRGVQLSGHLDVYCILDAKTAIVIDWKTGRKDTDYYHQLAGYAWLAHGFAPQMENTLCLIGWLRTGEVETYGFTPATLQEFRTRIGAEVIEWDGTYHPGAHCGGCPRMAGCPARTALIQATARELSQDEATSGATDGLMQRLADPATRDAAAPVAIELFQRVGLLEKAAETFKAQLKATLESTGPLSDGRLELHAESSHRQHLKTAEAWAVLKKWADPAALMEAVTISKTRALDAVAKAADRGSKGQLKEHVLDQLEKADAIETRTHTQLRLRRCEKAIESRTTPTGATDVQPEHRHCAGR